MRLDFQVFLQIDSTLEHKRLSEKTFLVLKSVLIHYFSFKKMLICSCLLLEKMYNYSTSLVLEKHYAA